MISLYSPLVLATHQVIQRYAGKQQRFGLLFRDDNAFYYLDTVYLIIDLRIGVQAPYVSSVSG
jgi:hypothetical protein